MIEKERQKQITTILKRLFIAVLSAAMVFTASGCFKIPLFQHPLAPSSDNVISTLVKNTWIAMDEDGGRMSLSFISQSSGKYLAIFSKTSIADGKLKSRQSITTAVISKAQNRYFMFFKEKDKKKQSTGESRIQTDIEDNYYFAFYFTLDKDSLSLYIVDGATIEQMIKNKELKGTVIKQSRYSTSIIVTSSPDELSRVLGSIDINKLIDTDSDSEKVRKFNRKKLQ